MPSHANIAFFIPHLGCPHCCSFCSQRTISGESSPISPDEVKNQLEEAFGRALNPETTEIAFFGGSFTCIPREQMIAYLEAAAPYIRNGQCRGIRLSTRPDGISREILDQLIQYGVSAIELGAQSMDDRVLALNQRGHTAEDVRKAVRLIREYPISLGLQIMTGLFGEDAESRARTEAAVLEMHPDTLRIYPTVVLDGTLLAEKFKAGEYRPPNLAETVQFAAPMLRRMEEAGIAVIRMGLHASPGIEQEMLGGAYHPAMRELCEAELFRQEMEKQLRDLPKGNYIMRVNPRAVSKAAGQKKRNLFRAQELGYSIRIVQDPACGMRELKIQNV
ncbi:MAG: elongator complex protein 3 [Candidatus Merdivicinus sp.]|jgi:histone acetyltransferase (RNA polymerase elongator complex component)